MIFLLSVSSVSLSSCRANELMLGNQARSDDTDIALNKVESFNYLSRSQILAKRSAQVSKFADLLQKPYEPNHFVFDQIVDNKPWWGMHGAFVFGEGQRSIEGPSEESRFVLNPYLLVAASSWSAEIWNKERITEEDLRQPDFPFCWNPVSLRFSPKQKTVSATYDVSSFNRSLEKWQDKIIDKSPIDDFGLVAYNARDFGFNYIFVPVDQCTNVKNLNNAPGPTDIKQYIHCGNTCKYSGDCNNMSPAQEQIDHFKFTALPTEVKVLLWKQKPPSTQTSPDMTVFINLH